MLHLPSACAAHLVGGKNGAMMKTGGKFTCSCVRAKTSMIRQSAQRENCNEHRWGGKRTGVRLITVYDSISVLSFLQLVYYKKNTIYEQVPWFKNVCISLLWASSSVPLSTKNGFPVIHVLFVTSFVNLIPPHRRFHAAQSNWEKIGEVLVNFLFPCHWLSHEGTNLVKRVHEQSFVNNSHGYFAL